MMARRILVALLLSVLLATTGAANSAIAAPKAELWDRWATFDGQSEREIDHSLWGYFLARYVVQNLNKNQYLVDYQIVTDQDNDILTTYLSQMIRTPISRYNRAQQKAYWINLYNALTVRFVLNHWPVRSIRDINISPGLFATGPWGAKSLTIEGEKVSLDDIEHRILRPIWKDARVHYTLVCAARGCPHLRPWPYDAEILDIQLNRSATEFINHPRAVWFEGASLSVSSLYDWYADDFGKDETDIIAHIRSFADPQLMGRLDRTRTIDDYDYDWDINDAD